MNYPRFRINMPLQEIISSVMTSLGKERKSYVREFASAFKRFGSFESVVMTGSGRSGFRLLLETLKFEPGSEIIFPAYTFHPIPVVAAECGLVPVFADVDAATWNIKPEAILSKITERTRAVVPTHLFGVPADMETINKIAWKHDLFVIEDCAHALGATYRGRPVGNFGDAAVFTFAMSKNLPCWGGGAVVVKDPELANRMLNRIKNEASPSSLDILRHQFPNIVALFFTLPGIFGWTLYPALRVADARGSNYFDRPFLEPVVPPHVPYSDQLFLQQAQDNNTVISNQLKGSSEQERITDHGSRITGFKQRITDHRSRITGLSPLQAATGLRQLRWFPTWLKQQVKNARCLRRRLSSCPKLQLQVEPSGARSSFLYLRARVSDPISFRRALRRRGVDTKPDDMSNCAGLGIFQEQPACLNAEHLSGHCIEIPCSPFYSERQIDDIAERVLVAAKLM